MSGRTTISVPDPLHERLDTLKREDESWPDFFERAADAVESQDGDGECTTDAHDPLTEAHIDDIGAEVERRVEKTLDNLQTRR